MRHSVKLVSSGLLLAAVAAAGACATDTMRRGEPLPPSPHETSATAPPSNDGPFRVADLLGRELLRIEPDGSIRHRNSGTLLGRLDESVPALHLEAVPHFSAKVINLPTETGFREVAGSVNSGWLGNRFRFNGTDVLRSVDGLVVLLGDSTIAAVSTTQRPLLRVVSPQIEDLRARLRMAAALFALTRLPAELYAPVSEAAKQRAAECASGLLRHTDCESVRWQSGPWVDRKVPQGLSASMETWIRLLQAGDFGRFLDEALEVRSTQKKIARHGRQGALESLQGRAPELLEELRRALPTQPLVTESGDDAAFFAAEAASDHSVRTLIVRLEEGGWRLRR